MSELETTTQPNLIGDADAAAVMSVLEEISLHDGAQSAILWQGGAIRWQGVVKNRVYNAWSCTKSFTSTCVGLMVDDGKLDLDASITDLLPELKEFYPAATLRNLLTFTTGYRSKGEGDPLVPASPLYPMGSCFNYSPESEWAALAVERVAGESMSSLFRRRIGDKIGIDYEYFRWGDMGERDGILHNGGSGGFEAGVHTCSENLLLFGRLMLQRGAWNGEQLISQAWLDDAQSSQKYAAVPPWDAQDGWYRDWLPGTYGLHWWVNGIKLNGQRLWPSGPGTIFAAQGNRNQMCMVMPEWDAVLIRMGDDGVINMADYDKVLKRLKESL